MKCAGTCDKMFSPSANHLTSMSMLDGSITSRRTGKQWKITLGEKNSSFIIETFDHPYLRLEVVCLNRKKNIFQLDSDWGEIKRQL